MTTTELQRRERTALVLTGGGARAAYQVGLLRCLGRHFPEHRFDIITGVSAGAINACYLASHPGSAAQAAADLTEVWTALEPSHVYRVDLMAMVRGFCAWGLRLVSGGSRLAPEPRALLDTSPLRRLLERTLMADEHRRLTGIQENLTAARLQALALTTLDWGTGRTCTWVEGREIERWERPGREGRKTRLTLEHVMASASLPLIFPAVQIGNEWHGDGGVRLAFPLAPALHLGADRILAISTRHTPPGGRRTPDTVGYPPPAQIAGVLLNAVFLDQLDADALLLERFNRLVRYAPKEEARALHPVQLVVIRPSEDLGRLSARFEPRLPRTFRFLTRGLGTRGTRSPDLLSLLLFQRDYVEALIEIGERDAEAHRDELQRLLLG